MSRRSWTDSQLINAVKSSYTLRRVIYMLGLVPAGGNYVQVKSRINTLKIDISHFTGSRWNKGMKMPFKPFYSLSEILIINSEYQSFKLKKRLFREKLKEQNCEECGWAKRSIDGRVPLELDHINGDRKDNRLENLRILCPNCHSLKPTHRGRNKIKARVV